MWINSGVTAGIAHLTELLFCGEAKIYPPDIPLQARDEDSGLYYRVERLIRIPHAKLRKGAESIKGPTH